MLVGRCLGGLTRGRDLGAQLFQLVVEALLVGEQLRQLAIPGVELGLLLLQMVECLLQNGVAARELGRIEGKAGRGFARAPIRACKPIADVEQLLDGPSRIGGRDAALLVHGAVAQAIDVFGLGEDGLARRTAERGLVQQRRDVVLVGEAEIRVGAERPLHRHLDRLAGEER